MTARRGLTLDTGALIGFERGDQRVRALLRNARANEREVTVPALVLAEAWRGGNARWLAELLDAAQIEPLDAPLARQAGELLARTGTDRTIDAVVAASAARRGDVIVSADPDDLQRCADDLGGVRVYAV